MHETLIGETAALCTAVCWSFTSIFFTIGGSRVGSVVVNRVRLILALVFLGLTHLLLMGEVIPFAAAPSRWFWLGLSGIIGFVLGDAMLFQAFVVIGTRVSMLLMSLVPVISTLLAWIFLGERLKAHELVGITVTLSGILWVIADKHSDPVAVKGRRLAIGIALGVGGAMGQATGLIASKKGMEGGFPALSANLIRIITATVVMWALTIALGKVRETVSKLRDRKADLAILGGATFGPFVGVWLSLIAIDHAPIGVAATLMALPPILILPLVHWIFKEKLTAGAVAGTLVAMAGVAVLLLA